MIFCIPYFFAVAGSESNIKAWDPAAGKFSFNQQVGEAINGPDQWDQQAAWQEQVNTQYTIQTGNRR